MKVVLQKVTEAQVEVAGELIGQIGEGYVILLGIRSGDTPADSEYLIEKILNLRIFPDEEAGKYFEKSLLDKKAELLVVSQFTLYGRVDKGRRPSFARAAAPDDARKIYEQFVEQIRERSGLKVETGQFQALMQVSLVNDGPCTLVFESPQTDQSTS